MTNALSALVGVLVLLGVLILGRETVWFSDLRLEEGWIVAVASPAFFMLGFLPTWIFCRAITMASEKVMAGPRQRRMEAAKRQQKDEADFIGRKVIFDKFQTLNDWQRHFLESCFNRGTPQVDRVDIGEYEAAWGPEIDVLIDKGFVRKITYWKYEIYPEVWCFMNENIDRERGEMFVDPPNGETMARQG